MAIYTVTISYTEQPNFTPSQLQVFDDMFKCTLHILIHFIKNEIGLFSPFFPPNNK